MKKFIPLLIFLLIFVLAPDVRGESSRDGDILLQVEKNGEAWYVHPDDHKRYFLARPADAFRIMKKLSLGVKHQFITENETFSSRVAGKILLDVDRNGEAYYIHPDTREKHYLARPADAFRIMRKLGQGVTNKELATIPAGDIEDRKEKPDSKIIIEGVPFSPQAPFAEWQDPRQQDGCEEASALMAMRWARNKNLTRQQALEEIINISEFLEDKYGEYRDTSLSDMKNQIFKDYFEYTQVEVRKDIEIADIVHHLQQGNLVLAPMDGQKLPNPYYTPPGPSRHMIVIRGYTPGQEEFITNDPGTRHGELFEYEEQAFYESIRAYPTGYHEPIPEISRDVIIVKK